MLSSPTMRRSEETFNEETFEEFSEGVIEIYASVGCWVCQCFVLVVSFVDSDGL